jgi:hypothetical protein
VLLRQAQRPVWGEEQRLRLLFLQVDRVASTVGTTTAFRRGRFAIQGRPFRQCRAADGGNQFLYLVFEIHEQTSPQRGLLVGRNKQIELRLENLAEMFAGGSAGGAGGHGLSS